MRLAAPNRPARSTLLTVIAYQRRPRAAVTDRAMSTSGISRIVVASAGSQTAYPWGDKTGTNNANCSGCGSKCDAAQAAPVGSFAPNKFGLYDMVGNVWEWVEDYCPHEDYDQPPVDGSAWMTGNCGQHRLCGGSRASLFDEIRSANRGRSAASDRLNIIGFRVGRTLDQ
jgi:formylglycine-generating enzyme required for sulfatase activity